MENSKSSEKSPKKGKLTKFFEHICGLTERERSDFVEFAKMTSGENTTQDTNLLEVFVDKFDITEDEYTIWDEVSKEKEIKNLKQIRGRLFKTLQLYSAMTQMEKNPYLQNSLLTQFYAERGRNKNLEAMEKNNEELMEKAQDDFELSLYKFWFHQLRVQQNKETREWDENVHAMAEHLDKFYHLNYLRLTAERVNRVHICKLPEDDARELLADIPQIIETFSKKDLSPIESLYLDILKMVHGRQKEQFDKVKEQLHELRDELSDTVLKEVKTNLANFCIQQINGSRDDDTVQTYAREHLKIRAQANSGSFLDKTGEISYHVFKNIVVLGIIANDIDWVYTFINQHKGAISGLDEADRKAFLRLIEALVTLYDGQLRECQDAIGDYQSSKMSKKDTYHKIMSEKIWLKLMYELYGGKSQKQLLTRIDSCRKSIRDKMNKERHPPQLDFLTYLRKLFRNNSIKIEEVKSSSMPFVDYLWFKRILR